MDGEKAMEKTLRPATLRAAAWIGAGLLWLAPLVAMQFTEEVRWDVFDFAVFGVMLAVAASLFDLATRLGGTLSRRAAFALTIGTGFVMTWANLAVGLVGSEDDPINLMFWAPLVVAFLGGVLVRFRPRPFSLVLVVTAVAQMAPAVIAAVMGWGLALAPAAFFSVLWLGATALFRVEPVTPR
jgi:hypothetical protein